MIDFDNIMFKISLEIEKIENQNKKITGRKIERYLRIQNGNYATIKSREVIPYKQIIEFCIRYNININSIFEG